MPAPGLRSLIVDSNLLEALSANFSRALQGLSILHLGSNPGLGGGSRALPSFQGWSRLSKLQLRTCGFAGEVPPAALDGLSNLTLLDLGFNALTGSLPSLLGAGVIDSLDLSDHNFSGGVPSSWAKLSTATSATLAWNGLSYPMDALDSMVSLHSLDLSHSALVVPPSAEFFDNVGAVVAGMVNNQLESLNIDTQPPAQTLVARLPRRRQGAQVRQHGIMRWKRCPRTSNMSVQEWDLSHNDLRGPTPAGTPVLRLVTSMLLTGNPPLQLYPLPAWLRLSDGGDMVSQFGSLYSCGRLVYSAVKNFRIEVDAQAALALERRCAGAAAPLRHVVVHARPDRAEGAPL